MFEHQGIWLPDGEKHFPEWMDANGELVDGKGTYQIKKFRAAMRHVKQHRVAVDVGAHVGLWSMQLARQFQQVHAFEPMPEFRACWNRNVVTPEGHLTVLYPSALGAEPGHAHMRYRPADSGGTHVGELLDAADAESVPVRTLDEFALPDVDFLKIDCEGFESEVLHGAQETLTRCRPCVIVEQKARCLKDNYGVTGTPAVDFLRGLGARVLDEISGDYILAWA